MERRGLVQFFDGFSQGGAEGAEEGFFVVSFGVDVGERGELVDGKAVLACAVESCRQSLWGGPRDVAEEFGLRGLEGEEMIPSVRSGAYGSLMLGVELGEGSMNPAGGNIDAIRSNDGNFCEALRKAVLEGAA